MIYFDTEENLNEKILRQVLQLHIHRYYDPLFATDPEDNNILQKKKSCWI